MKRGSSFTESATEPLSHGHGHECWRALAYVRRQANSGLSSERMTVPVGQAPCCNRTSIKTDLWLKRRIGKSSASFCYPHRIVPNRHSPVRSFVLSLHRVDISNPGSRTPHCVHPADDTDDEDRRDQLRHGIRVVRLMDIRIDHERSFLLLPRSNQPSRPQGWNQSCRERPHVGPVAGSFRI